MNTTLSPITKERPDDDSLMIMIVMMTNNHSNRLAASSSRKFKMLLNTKCALLSAGHFFLLFLFLSIEFFAVGFLVLFVCAAAMVCCLLCKPFGFVSRTTFTCAYKTHLLEYFSCLLYRPGSVYGCFNDKSSKHYDRSESKTPFRVRHRNI